MSYRDDRSNGRSGGGGGGGGGCFTCGEEGHISRNCKQNRRGENGDAPRYRKSNDMECYKCGKPGHMARDCRGGGGGGGSGGGYRGGDRDRNYDSRRVFNNGKPTLFVANLPEDGISEKRLKEIFPDAANCRVPNNYKGYAFIEYENESDMERDLDEKRDYTLEGKTLSIDRSKNNSGGGGGGGSRGRGGGSYGGGGYSRDSGRRRYDD